MIVLICIGITSVIGFYTPIKISELFASYDSPEKFNATLKILLGLFLFEYINVVVYQAFINKYIEKMITHVRSIPFNKWLRTYEISNTEKDKFPLGEVLSRIMSDSEALQELASTGTFGFIINVIFILSCLVSFLTLNTSSGILLIAAEVFACSLLLYLSKFMVKVFMDVRDSQASMSKTLANITSGFKQSYYTIHENYASKKSDHVFEVFLKKQLNANIWDASYYSLAESLYPILLAFLVFVFPFSRVTEIAIIAAIIDVLQRSIGPIKEITGKITNIQRARTGVIRIGEFTTYLENLPSSYDEMEFKENLFESVSINIDHFSYGSKSDFEIKNVRITGKSGELIGLVGKSGCGKSTILKILSANILAPQCQIELNLKDKEITFKLDDLEMISDYRKYVSIVSQDSHVFTESLKFNITLGYETKNFEEQWSSIKSSIPYLAKWDFDLDSKIIPDQLSLGQKQLISAIRSCILFKPIVLFDEISSGMDSELELALREMVLYIQKHALTIIVAHRVETIVAANQIIVMEDGKINSVGQHDSLVKSSDVYREFIDKISSLS